MEDIERLIPLPYPACQHWKERMKYIIDETGGLTDSFPFGRTCELGKLVFEADALKCENSGINPCWQRDVE